MAVTITPSLRSVGAGAAAAVVLIGAFALGVSRGNASSGGPGSTGGRAGVQLTSVSSDARITVTGTGTVTGTPNQLTLNMGVQVTAASVDSAIQTSGLYIQPNYGSSSQAVTGYGASESLTATLDNISRAGAQIQAAVHAGG